MNRIDATFERLRRKGEKALIPYLTAGDPDLEVTVALILEFEGRGADIVEIGVPFSDPLADGVTIQRASQRALQKGTTLSKILRMIVKVRRRSQLPLVLMSYFNPILRFGIQRFVKEATAAGVDGVILPDLPPEEAGELRQASEEAGLHPIFLLAPTSSEARIDQIADASKGYIYYVSLRGVTGARDRLAEGVGQAVLRIKAKTKTPVAVGFGIGTPDQARVVASYADGVIVGSAIVARVEEHLGRTDLVQRVGAFVAQVKAAMLERGSQDAGS
ncbi:MAG: tryptophan synthase subunit alpha [candidate division NC10 bacterium]|nr:tryptophan synthase subunit alpha [candidate division NC10 bacterium]